MATNRIGRRSAASIARGLANDPRLRRAQQGGVTDNDVDNITLAFNSRGEMRVAAAEGVALLDEETAGLADVVAKVNELLLALNAQEV